MKEVQTVGTRNVKLRQARPLKRTYKTRRKTLPPNRAKTLPNTAVNDAMRKQQYDDQRVPPQKSQYDQIPCNPKYGEDRIPFKQQYTQNNNHDQILSNRNKK